MHSEANSSPQQRIITSEQWVFDRKGPKDDFKTHGGNRPKRATISKQEREMRRKQRELETEQLQQEYQTVQSENSRLKTVVAKLKQDIDVYTRLVVESSRGEYETPTASLVEPGSVVLNENTTGMSKDELPPLETLLVNSSKRRKRGRNSEHTQPEAADGRSDMLRNKQADVMLAPGAADVGPEDVALMCKLKDVLAEME
ncbi:LANO_0D07668g1_1 [Lachancea nothofagi CBS 11611]|uniref:LANO_0D07668g1_1 n=1 Tax=Lachancea nothofagi CBS 11611 TaxID=1266666 RepID=A0A1G4JIZ1_9SACH|nr:LANO_0D07668g1_1 [Lachancea nothofagi CBS 11611]